MVVLILHMQICFFVEGLSLPLGEWYTPERDVYPNIGWDVNLLSLGAVVCDSSLVFGSLTMPCMFCQCLALHVCLYVLTGMLYTLCRFQVTSPISRVPSFLVMYSPTRKWLGIEIPGVERTDIFKSVVSTNY